MEGGGAAPEGDSAARGRGAADRDSTLGEAG